MKIIDAAKFEKLLVTEHKYLVRSFNAIYAGTTQTNVNLINAKVLESRIEVLTSIIEALQESAIEGGY
jgi:hypothetical protein